MQDSIPAAEAEQYEREHSGEVNALPWNGGLSSVQRTWLQEALQQAEADSVKVIVAGHHPIGSVRPCEAIDVDAHQALLTGDACVLLLG